MKQDNEESILNFFQQFSHDMSKIQVNNGSTHTQNGQIY